MVSTVPTKKTPVSKTEKIVAKRVKKKVSAVKEVLAVASEIYPLIKTGGLADVVGALPSALHTYGVHVTTLVPGYPRVMSAVRAQAQAKIILNLRDFFGSSVQLWSAQVAGMDLFVLDAPHLFEREGNPYLNANGQDWHDNPIRFAALSLMGAQLAWGEYPELHYQPDAMHVHDWQTALAPVYLHYLGKGKHHPKTIITIHNLAFQGQFSAELFPRLGLPAWAFSTEGLDIMVVLATSKRASCFRTKSPPSVPVMRMKSPPSMAVWAWMGCCAPCMVVCQGLSMASTPRFGILRMIRLWHKPTT